MKAPPPRVKDFIVFLIGTFVGIVFNYNMMLSASVDVVPQVTKVSTSRLVDNLQATTQNNPARDQAPEERKSRTKQVCEDDTDILYPYKKYNNFGMGWRQIVEELEWSHSNSKSNDPFKESPTMFSGIVPSYGLMSPNFSKIYLFEPDKPIKKGDYIHIVIESYDNYGNRRFEGGDYLALVMGNIGTYDQRTSGRVVDYGNGTYSVYFYAAWSGKALIKLNFVLSREAVMVLNHIYGSEKGHRGWEGFFYPNGTTSYAPQRAVCKLSSEGIWENACGFVNPRSMGRAALVCHRPTKYSCEDLQGYAHHIDSMQEGAVDLVKEDLYLFDMKTTDVDGGLKIKVDISDSQVVPNLPACGPDLPIPLSDGYWKDGSIFVPLVCKSQQWSVAEKSKCLAGKRLYMYGDSTVRNYCYSICDLNKVILNDTDRLPQYVQHGLRIGGSQHWISHFILDADFIDSKVTCSTYTPVLVINFSFHFGTWTTRTYLNKLFYTKLAMIRLFKRCPGAIIVVKLAHPRENHSAEQAVHSSNYRFYDFNRMARRVFGGIGVRFLDTWNLIDSHSHGGCVHPPDYMDNQGINLLFSYICPEMVKTPIF